MGFLLVGFILWGLMIASVLLFIFGLGKKSWKLFTWSGMAFLIPSIILATQKGLFSLFLLLPLIAFGAAFYMHKR
jgi:hypothetical protein